MGMSIDQNQESRQLETLYREYAKYLRELIEESNPFIERFFPPDLIEKFRDALSFPTVRICADPEVLGGTQPWSFDDQREAAVQNAAEKAMEQVQALLDQHGIGALVELESCSDSWENCRRQKIFWDCEGWIVTTPGLLAEDLQQDLRQISDQMSETIDERWGRYQKDNNRAPGLDLDSDPLSDFLP